MKKIIIIAIIVFTTITVYGQRKLKKLEVKEEGFNINMSFQPIVDKMNYKGLSIQITPVSGDELNDIFVQESYYDGKFKYSNYKVSRDSYFLKKRRGKREKPDLEYFLEGIGWLFDNDKINQEEYNHLEKDILYYFDKDYAEQYYNANRITSSNPYYLNGKYLNVFKINISNPSSSFVTLDKELIIENGNLLLNQMSSRNLFSDLDSIVLIRQKKTMALERHNFKKGVIIPPKSEVEKLFAIIPIDFNHPTLKISMKGLDNKFLWTIVKDEKIINELYIFYELALKWNVDYDIQFSIIRGNTKNIYIDERQLFIGDNNLNNTFEIFTIALDRNTLFYGRNSNLKGIDFINKEKLRRKPIRSDIQKIDELKKKVKD